VLIIPAIDLKDNKCVRLSMGEDKTSVVFNDNPSEQAKYFEDIGCKKLHIVDLDAAFGRKEINISSINKIRETISIPIQLGGGIRSIIDAERYFNLGIDNLIIGSMSINQSDDVISLSNKYKEKIYVSLDVKDNSLMIKGWKEKTNITINEIFSIYDSSSIKGYVITDIKNDGMLKGLDTSFISNIINQKNNNSKNKLFIIAGGLTNYNDLENLNKLKINNIEGIISGKSFYVGNIDLIKAQKILKKNG
jgi:Phosphoribosylformimino-5-aminoimidazole carboxamide ribonucleotide (ProFAR) isomerase